MILVIVDLEDDEWSREKRVSLEQADNRSVGSRVALVPIAKISEPPT